MDIYAEQTTIQHWISHHYYLLWSRSSLYKLMQNINKLLAGTLLLDEKKMHIAQEIYVQQTKTRNNYRFVAHIFWSIDCKAIKYLDSMLPFSPFTSLRSEVAPFLWSYLFDSETYEACCRIVAINHRHPIIYNRAYWKRLQHLACY